MGVGRLDLFHPDLCIISRDVPLSFVVLVLLEIF